MSHPSVVLLVKFKSRLAPEKLREVIESRIDQFRALEGLQQKYYLEDSTTGEIAGLYLWKSPQALAEYRESELRATIAEAYQAEGETRVEAYRVLEVLRD